MKMQKNSKMVHYEVIQNCLVIYLKRFGSSYGNIVAGLFGSSDRSRKYKAYCV